MAIVASGEMAVTPDLKGFESSLGSSIGGLAKKAAVVFGGAFAASSAVDFFKSAVGGASDLNESIGKVGVVFGSSSKEIEAFAANAAKSMGQSKQQALEAAGTFGNLAVSLGLPQAQAATMSKSLVTLATDLASFNNTSVDDALLALRSGLTGETEPLKRYGIALDDATLRQKAMAMGLVKSTKDVLPPAVKAQASYALIMERSKTAQGDFARTSDGLANKQRILGAQITDLKTRIGSALLPVISNLTSFAVNQLIPAFEKLGPVFRTVSEPVGMFINALRTGFTEDEGTAIESWALRLRDVIKKLGEVLSNVISFVMDHKEVLVGLAAAIASGLVPAFVAWATAAGAAAIATIAAAAPVIAVGVAIGALVAALVYAYKHWTLFHDVVNNVAGFITGTLVPVIGTIAGAIGRFIALYVKVMIAEFSTFKEIGVGAFNAVKATVQFFIDKIRTAWEWVSKLIEKIKHIPGAGVAKNVLHAVGVPGFAEGGVVPGPIGAPRLAIVHGGEEVLTPAQRGYGRGGPLVGQMIIQGATFEGANATAYAAVRELRGMAFRQGK